MKMQRVWVFYIRDSRLHVPTLPIEQNIRKILVQKVVSRLGGKKVWVSFVELCHLHRHYITMRFDSMLTLYKLNLIVIVSRKSTVFQKFRAHSLHGHHHKNRTWSETIQLKSGGLTFLVLPHVISAWKRIRWNPFLITWLHGSSVILRTWLMGISQQSFKSHMQSKVIIFGSWFSWFMLLIKTHCHHFLQCRISYLDRSQFCANVSDWVNI